MLNDQNKTSENRVALLKAKKDYKYRNTIESVSSIFKGKCF